MEINIRRIPTGFVGETCYTHARAAITPDGFGIITTQPLRLSGSDIFYGMHMLKSCDGGKSWSDIESCSRLGRIGLTDGTEMALADATPMYHRATGKILLIGVSVYYKNDDHAGAVRGNQTAYSVYDEQTGDFGKLQVLDLSEKLGDGYFTCCNGCGQSIEIEGGDLLIPVYHYSKAAAANIWRGGLHAAVIRAGFDGERLYFKEIGSSLTCDVPRGLYEPSITCFADKYYLCMRNDANGYISVGEDGLSFGKPVPLTFDDGESVGNYNTQQHWIRLSDKLYLVYTRRGADNDHIFRHRAPLFIAELDTDRLCLIRDTERIVVPERGARLGNFGCSETADGRALVVVSEWMQTTDPDPSDWRRCMEFGSDNSIFVSEITL